jgi:DNA invertase Pin-like site-specific DNA recombinase
VFVEAKLDTPPAKLSGDASSVTRAAEYVRMSTEHQQYSTENQSDAIGRYAESRGFSIIRKYADDGKSGLNIAGRGALQQLIGDVTEGTANFTDILVYDVSRWGRFQDADESAYYEYLCKKAGVKVHYCAEPFENDGSQMSTLLKTIKRTMAGEYSRDLSVKVFAGQCRLIELGFRQGGPPGYGLRRELRDQYGKPKMVLRRGEHKSMQTDRVVLIPGPDDEVDVVREVYRRFIEDRETERAIASALNARGVATDKNRPWAGADIYEILTNPKYAGANVYNRRSFKLKKRRVKNTPDMWIRNEAAFTPLIDPAEFQRAQEIMSALHRRYSDSEMLDFLRAILASRGQLSGIIIDETAGLPSSAAYQARFKSLLRAYSLIGYTPDRDYAYLTLNRRLREKHTSQVEALISALAEVGATVAHDRETGLLTINDGITASVILARCREPRPGEFRWLLRLEPSLAPDITVAVRLAPGNEDVLDYYLFPRIDVLAERVRLAPQNGFVIDVYRFDDLSFFLDMARQRSLPEVP